MKTSRDPRIDAYIADAAGFARPILRHVRVLVHRACPAVGEAIKWSQPSFVIDGKIMCWVAAFKAHCVLGFWHQGMNTVLTRAGGKAAGMEKRTRLTSLADLPDDATMVRLLEEAAKLAASGTPGWPRRAVKPKPAAKTPADLAAALKTNKMAAAAFDKFSPSHRREYIAWITEARSEATRAKRLATTLEWLAEGKPRNWRYLSC